MTDKPLKRLTLRVENETKEEIVLIFAEPSTKDLEDLIKERRILELINNLLWKIDQPEHKDDKDDIVAIETKPEPSKELILVEEIAAADKTGIKDEKDDIDINIEVKAELSDEEATEENILEAPIDIPGLADDNFETYDEPIDDTKDIDGEKINISEPPPVSEKKSTPVVKKRKVKARTKKGVVKKEKCEDEELYKDPDDNALKKPVNRYAKMEAKFVCDRCEKRFRRKNDLTTHITNVHLKVKHHCDQCEAVLSSVISLKQHIRMKHSGVNETHVCNVCGKNFSHKQYLDKHLLTHENTEKNFVCKECGKCFGYKGSLKKHVQEHHENFFRYTCEECGQTFIDLLRYNMHMETTHQKGEKFTCNICGKTIIGKHRFKVHTSRHPKSLKYVPCSECGEEVPETHMRFHVAQAHKAENWKYKCPYCPRKMEKAAYIRIHIRSHTGAKPYRCHGCNKGFTTRESIKKHIKDFHNDDKSLMFFDRSLDVDENFKINK